MQVYLHLIWSTKNRAPFLQDPDVRKDLHEYLGGTCNGIECPVLRVGGVEDHVHVLCRMGKSHTVPGILSTLKRESSLWIKDRALELPDFYWQAGYGAFSVSPSHIKALMQYIADQEAHHRTESFQDEFRRLCKKYGAAIDERYVWD